MSDVIQGFVLDNDHDEVISLVLESLGLRPEATTAPGFVRLLVVDATMPIAELERTALAAPEGQSVWAFSSSFKQISLPALKMTHVPAKSRREFMLKIAGHIDKAVKEQAPGSPLRPVRPDFPRERQYASSAAQLRIEAGGRQVNRVTMDGVDFDFLTDLRTDTSKLVVLGQDAITRSQVELPHFFRWSWAPQIDASVMIWSDPTLYVDASLDGAWWVGTPRRDYVAEAVPIIKRVMDAVGAKPQDVTFVGMSAGGLSSLQMASLLPGSSAVLDIPYTSLLRAGEKDAQVARAIKLCLGFDSPEQIPNELLPRVDSVARFRQTGVVPEVLYCQNLEDVTHLQTQYHYFLDELESIPGARDRVTLFEYSQRHLVKGGHFPLPEREMIDLLNRWIIRRRKN